MTIGEVLEKKLAYLEELARFLERSLGYEVELYMDANEYVTARVMNRTFEYSVWGDSVTGIFLDTIRAFQREGIFTL